MGKILSLAELLPDKIDQDKFLQSEANALVIEIKNRMRRKHPDSSFENNLPHVLASIVVRVRFNVKGELNNLWRILSTEAGAPIKRLLASYAGTVDGIGGDKIQESLLSDEEWRRFFQWTHE